MQRCDSPGSSSRHNRTTKSCSVPWSVLVVAVSKFDPQDDAVAEIERGNVRHFTGSDRCTFICRPDKGTNYLWEDSELISICVVYDLFCQVERPGN